MDFIGTRKLLREGKKKEKEIYEKEEGLMKRKHGKKKENSENTYNVEIHNFCYIPKKLM